MNKKVYKWLLEKGAVFVNKKLQLFNKKLLTGVTEFTKFNIENREVQMEYTVDELNELATLIAKFNAQNAPIPGHKSFVHINSLEDYGTPAPNGAVCALHFSEHTFGKDFDSKFEFVSFEKLITYLRVHTN